MLTGKAEQPWRGRRQRAGGQIQHRMRRPRYEAGQSPPVICPQGIAKQAALKAWGTYCAAVPSAKASPKEQGAIAGP